MTGCRINADDLARIIADAERLLEFEEATKHRPPKPRITPAQLVEFLEVFTGDAFDVPPERAIAYFQAKGLKPTFSYADMLAEAHEQAFTVAKMMDVDLLGQVRKSLDDALTAGETFNDWKRKLQPTLEKAGWWGRQTTVDPVTGGLVEAQLGSPWRLETIFRTNMQTAYAVGQWDEIAEQAEVAPYLMYDAVDDTRTRPEHAAWDRKVLPVTHRWWRTHFPPNGYNCRCSVIQLDRDEVEALGLEIDQTAPADGTYTWTNPRTGEKVQIPIGIDPGFQRNPGRKHIEDLGKILEDKIEALPPDMKQAVQPTLRRQFNALTAAGRWHAVSFDKSPNWIRDKVLDMQDVQVQASRGTGAYARMGELVDMNGKDITTTAGQEVWRHEFGHIMDVRMAKTAMYRSSQTDFLAAQKADANTMMVTAGNARKSKANDAARQEVVDAYAGARDRVVDATADTREALVRDMARAAGLDYDAFLTVVRESTKILEGEGTRPGIGALVRIARMIEAIRLRDGEGFVRFASFKDTIDEMIEARQRIPTETRMLHGESWRKDGALASLSDLIGSATRNKAASYRDGFPGHSDRYYRARDVAAPTESFANLTALAGHQNRYWWEIVRILAPSMAQVFQRIMETE